MKERCMSLMNSISTETHFGGEVLGDRERVWGRRCHYRIEGKEGRLFW